MTALQAIWIENCISLNHVPIDMFNLPNLIELSLFNGNIYFDDLVEYNVPENNWNDTEAVNQYFDRHLQYNLDHTQYWIAEIPIYEEDWTDFPDSLRAFLNQTDF